MTDFKGLLLDIGGVILQGQQLVTGSDRALQYLRQTRRPLRFVTNTTKSSKESLIQQLRDFNIEVDAAEVLTAPTFAADLLRENDLRPYLLVHKEIEIEFKEFSFENPNAVVVGDAPSQMTYENLNRAFRILQEGGLLIALGKARCFADNDGRNSLDSGPFVRLLEYASNKNAALVGKPSTSFFTLALQSMGCEPNEAMMLGDDVQSDCNAAIEMGIPAGLVKTGKYQAGDEKFLLSGENYVFENLLEAVNKLFFVD